MMTPIVIDRHAGCEYEFYHAICDCGWRSGTCLDYGEANDQWRKHRANPDPLGDRFRVVTSADSRNKRELVRVWEVEAADETEAEAEALIAHAPRVGYRGIYVRRVERILADG